jgi:hypothetical protein
MVYSFNVSKVQQEKIKDNDNHPFKIEDLKAYKKKICGEILQSSDISNLSNCYYENSFVGTLLACYNNHYNLIIRPDDVWIAIIAQFSLYVTKNSESLRSKFVNFDGKQNLTVFQMATLRTANYSIMAEQMVDEITKNIINPDMKKWLIPSFSTTTKTDIIVGAILMMSSMQKYFDYKMHLCCGIPNITVLGTKEDWQDITNRLKGLLLYNDNNNYMQSWYDLLVPIMNNFEKSVAKNPDIEWWDKICSKHGGGSGPRYISGWCSVFCVFNEEGNWQGSTFKISGYNNIKSDWPIIDTNDIPCGYVTVPVMINDNGVEYNSLMVAGHMAKKVSLNSNTIQPSIDWFIGVKDDDKIKKASADRW